MYIYLSNEDENSVDVFFDDLGVEQTKGPVVQVDDYYSFGLTFNSFQMEKSIKNNYLYNSGAERQDELELNVDATKFRTYDPALGRWWQIDPLADNDSLAKWTPYNYSYNNPVRYNDPNGDCPCIALPILYEAGVALVEGLTIYAGAKAVEAGANALLQEEQGTTSMGASLVLGNAVNNLHTSKVIPKKTFKEILDEVQAAKEKAAQKAKQEQKDKQKAEKEKTKAQASQGSAEHTKNARAGTKNTHEKGQARTKKAQKKSNNPNKKKPHIPKPDK